MADVIVSLLWAWAVCRLLTAAPRFDATSLATAWRWAVTAAAVWTMAWIALLVAGGSPASEALWYAAAVVSLCPPIAVLGARRPAVRVWSYFVLLPLVAVLTLPVLAGAWPLSAGSIVRAPLPLVIGFAVVLLMGAGNYAGTRYAGAAVLLSIGICLVAAPVSDAAPASLASSDRLRTWGTACVAASILWGRRQSRRPTLARSGLERVWFDFRDTFGIVWARRILERVNQRADAEGWAWRLADSGFAPAESTPPPGAPDADPRIEHTLRWLLRRFVDPEWIDRRLNGGEPPVSAT